MWRAFSIQQLHSAAPHRNATWAPLQPHCMEWSKLKPTEAIWGMEVCGVVPISNRRLMHPRRAGRHKALRNKKHNCPDCLESIFIYKVIVRWEATESAREERLLLDCDQDTKTKNAKAVGSRPRKCFVTQTLTGMVQLTKAGIKAVCL